MLTCNTCSADTDVQEIAIIPADPDSGNFDVERFCGKCLREHDLFCEKHGAPKMAYQRTSQEGATPGKLRITTACLECAEELVDALRKKQIKKYAKILRKHCELFVAGYLANITFKKRVERYVVDRYIVHQAIIHSLRAKKPFTNHLTTMVMAACGSNMTVN